MLKKKEKEQSFLLLFAGSLGIIMKRDAAAAFFSGRRGKRHASGRTIEHPAIASSDRVTRSKNAGRKFVLLAKRAF